MPLGQGNYSQIEMEEGHTVARLEEELLRVPGVRSARVVGDDAPTEIHIVATHERSPKQLVRDVQSLAAAGYGMPIDHRIVSIVQLDEEPPPGAEDRRPVLERVIFASKGPSGWVKVGLRWPDGSETEGAGVAGATREARARGAAAALVKALEPVLGASGAGFEVDHVVVHRVGQNDSVVVRGVYYESGSSTPLVGSALVYDDVASAAVRALLHAINRKLR